MLHLLIICNLLTSRTQIFLILLSDYLYFELKSANLNRFFVVKGNRFLYIVLFNGDTKVLLNVIF